MTTGDGDMTAGDTSEVGQNILPFRGRGGVGDRDDGFVSSQNKEEGGASGKVIPPGSEFEEVAS